MVFDTLKKAQAELARLKITMPKYKHRIAKFEVHRFPCLHNDGLTGLPPSPCTCGGTGEYRYTICLGPTK